MFRTAGIVGASVGLVFAVACATEGQARRSSADELSDALAQEWALKALTVKSVARLADDMFDLYPATGFTGADLNYEQRIALWSGRVEVAAQTGKLSVDLTNLRRKSVGQDSNGQTNGYGALILALGQSPQAALKNAELGLAVAQHENVQMDSITSDTPGLSSAQVAKAVLKIELMINDVMTPDVAAAFVAQRSLQLRNVTEDLQHLSDKIEIAIAGALSPDIVAKLVSEVASLERARSADLNLARGARFNPTAF
jgi:hypothetical protein